MFLICVCSDYLVVRADTQELKSVTVAYFYDENYFGGKNDDEIKSGFGYEYLQEIANFAGWKYKYVYGDYNSLLEQFMRGKIDIMPMVSRDFDVDGYYEAKIAAAKTADDKSVIEENKIQVLYSNQPMSSEDYYLCIPQEKQEDFGVADLYNANVAVSEELADKAKGWLEGIGLMCNIEKYTNSAACINALNKGDVTAIIDTSDVVDVGLVTYRKLGSIDYYLAFPAKNRDLVREANNSLECINESTKCFTDYIRYAYRISDKSSEVFSEEENEWIKEHRIINIGTLYSDMPFSAKNEENGMANGFVSPVVDELLANVNLSCEYTFYDDYASLINGLNSGEIDAAIPVPTYIYEAECDGYMCTDKLFSTNMILLYKGEYSEQGISNIAVNVNDISYTYVKNMFPTAQLIQCESDKECVDKVLSEENICTVVNEYKLKKVIPDNFKYGKLETVTLNTPLSMSIAVKRGDATLFYLLNRCASLAEEVVISDAILDIAANNTIERQPFLQRLLQIEYIVMAVVFLILLLVIFFLIRTIKKMGDTSKRLKRANKEIKGIAEHQQHNFDVIGILARDYSSVYKVNLVTEEVEVYRMEEKGEGKYADLLRMGNKFTEVFNEYVRENVFEDDKQKMYDEVSLAVVRKKLKLRQSYAIRFRKVDKDGTEPRYYEMRVSSADSDNLGKLSDVIVGFVDCNAEILHEVEYTKSLEKTLKSDAVITGLAGDFDWVAYAPVSEDSDADMITHYRVGDLFKAKFDRFEEERNFHVLLEQLATAFVIEDDRKRFLKETKKAYIIKHLIKDSIYFVNFRIKVYDAILYYQFKFVADVADGKMYGFIIGFHSVDDELRKEKEQQEKLEQMVYERTIQLEEKNQSLNRMNNDIIELMGNVVEGRDAESGEHVKRVKGFTNILAIQVMTDLPEYGLTPEKVDIITSASALHDVGKITIPDNILLKPGRLNDEEFKMMQRHTVNGCKLLESMPADWGKQYLQTSLDICRHHHEKYDGRGYPDKLSGDDIPISAQIVSIADCYDALVSKRVYKDAYSCEQAFNMICNGECGVFSPKLLACFAKCKGAFADQVKITRHE